MISIAGKPLHIYGQSLKAYSETAPVKLKPNPSEQELDIVIRAIYRQVLGNVHLMESERLVGPESKLRDGATTVREFVRQVAKSDLYRRHFFENCYRSRAIEVNFKHLLGRAPQSAEELKQHSDVLDTQGFEADIDTYIDSDEYQDAFGEFIVPYYRGHQTQPGQAILGYTNLLQLFRSASSSDNSLSKRNAPQLTEALIRGLSYGKYKKLAAPGIFGASLHREATHNGLPPQLQAKLDGPPESPEAILLQQHLRGLMADSEGPPLELTANPSAQELDIVIRAVYRQVLGNAHVMESERLVGPESQLRDGTSSVREFVRQVAKSELYRRRFFENCYRYRAIEVNFKHLLGRAPQSFEEMKQHSEVLDTQGFEADIDTYIDSDEYQDAFGEFIVPYYWGHQTQTGQSMLGYVNLLKLFRSASSSDMSLAKDNKPKLAKALLPYQTPGKIVIRDAQDIIAEALRIGSQPQQPQLSQPSQAEDALRAKLDEQTETIAQLRQELADLRPFVSIGVAMTRDFSVASDARRVPQVAVAASPLQQQVNEQAALIEQLHQDIAAARPLAALANAKLNKWRQRYSR